MDKRDLAFLMCRGLSLYSLVLGMGPLGNGFGMFLWNSGPQRYSGFDWSYTLRVSGMPAILYLVMALLLWLGAGKLSHAMAGPESSTPKAAAEGADWTEPAVRLVGLLVLVLAVPQVASLSTSYYLAQAMPDLIAEFGPQAGRGLVPTAAEAAVRLAIGAWLMLGTPDIARILRAARDTARNVGRDEPVAS